jgi:hypothetical protein
MALSGRQLNEVQVIVDIRELQLAVREMQAYLRSNSV